MQNKFVYCDNRECADSACRRWYKHAPFNEVIVVRRCKLDKNGMCKDRL